MMSVESRKRTTAISGSIALENPVSVLRAGSGLRNGLALRELDDALLCVSLALLFSACTYAALVLSQLILSVR